MKSIENSCASLPCNGSTKDIDRSNLLAIIKDADFQDARNVDHETSSSLHNRPPVEQMLMEGAQDCCDEPSNSRDDKNIQRVDVPSCQQGPYSISPMRDTSNMCMKSESTFQACDLGDGDLGVGFKPTFPEEVMCSGMNPRRIFRRRKHKLFADDLSASSACANENSLRASDDEHEMLRLQSKRTRYFSESPEPSSESIGPEESDAPEAHDHISDRRAPSSVSNLKVTDRAIGNSEDVDDCSTAEISLIELDCFTKLLNSSISFRRVRIKLKTPSKNRSDRKSNRRPSCLSKSSCSTESGVAKLDQNSPHPSMSVACSEPALRSRYPLRRQAQSTPNAAGTPAADCSPSKSCHDAEDGACKELLPLEKNFKPRLKAKSGCIVTDLDQMSKNDQPNMPCPQLFSGVKGVVDNICQSSVGSAECDSMNPADASTCDNGVACIDIREATICLESPESQLDFEVKKLKGVDGIEITGKHRTVAVDLSQLSAPSNAPSRPNQSINDSGRDSVKPGDHESVKPVKAQPDHSLRANRTTSVKKNSSSTAVFNGANSSKSKECTAHDSVGPSVGKFKTCEKAVDRRGIKSICPDSSCLPTSTAVASSNDVTFPSLSERGNSLQVLANAANAALEHERSVNCKSPANNFTMPTPFQGSTVVNAFPGNTPPAFVSCAQQCDNSKDFLSSILHDVDLSRNTIFDSAHSRHQNGIAQIGGLLQSAGLTCPPISSIGQVDPITGAVRTQFGAQFSGNSPYNMPFQSGMPLFASSNGSSLLSNSNILGQILAPSLSDNLKVLSPALSQPFRFLGGSGAAIGADLLGSSRAALGQGVSTVQSTLATQGQRFGLALTSGNHLGGTTQSMPVLNGMSQSSPPQMLSFSGNGFLNCMGNSELFGRNTGDSSMVAAAAQLTAAAALFQVLKSSPRQF